MKRKLITILIVLSVLHFVTQSWTFWQSLDDTWTYTRDPRREAICRLNMAVFGVLALPLDPWTVLSGTRACRLMDNICKDHGVAPIVFIAPLFVLNSLIWGMVGSGVVGVALEMRKRISHHRSQVTARKLADPQH